MNQTTICLSDQNYYSNKADWQYMSVSQYKEFFKCEAAEVAKLNETWQPSSDPTALLVGNYVHSFFESEEAHTKFIEENKDSMFSVRKPYGLLKAYQIAEDMINALQNQKAFTKLYEGEKEHICSGELFGTEWKAKIDCLNVEGSYFVDIKTSADLDKKVWNDRYGTRVSWVVDFGYYLQMAVYRALLKQEYGKEFTPIIAAVSKQSPPSFKLYRLDENVLSFEMTELERNLEHVLAVKNGQAKPNYCGKCEYCRGHMQVTTFSNTED